MAGVFVLALVCALLSTASCSPCVHRDEFGELGNRPVYRYTLATTSANAGGRLEVQVIDYGATLTSIKMPDRHGVVDDVLLGFDNLDGYLSADNPYFGATVGRVANRIGNATFTLDNVTYHLYPNIGHHTLHGGRFGFDKKHWNSKMEDGRVIMEYVSEDGEESFPGRVTASVCYSLAEDGTFVIEYKATSTKRCPINLTNHAYFNLAGHAAGASALYKHNITIASGYITETDAEFISTGKLTALEGTPSDFRSAKVLGDVIHLTNIDGYDFNYVLNNSTLETQETPNAIVEDPVSGRRMEMVTTQLGVQFYTSNSLDGVVGKGGSVYGRHGALCLEAQNWPDAINKANFPNSVYGPGEVYHQVTKYKFLLSEHNES